MEDLTKGSIPKHLIKLAVPMAIGMLVTFAVPLMWLTTQPDFHIEQVWYLSVATVGIQTLLSLFFVRRMLKKQLKLQKLVGV